MGIKIEPMENNNKYLEGIKGKILSFGKKKQSGYSDLAPVDELNGKKETIDALRWAMKNPRVTNIALTGPFGAGKSSVINAYIKKYHKCTWLRDKRILRLSLATFDGQRMDDENNLEKGILKQLFYKVNARKIPQSRYRKLHATNLLVYVIRTVSILALGACCLYVFKQSAVTSIADYYTNTASVMERKIYIGAWIVLLIGISCVVKYFASRLKVKEISFGEFAAKAEEKDNESVFDKNIDEILYFFEQTKFNIVIIEDLDRFDNTEVFVRLRELNTLINNSDAIKQRVKFIYAVKDELFNEETERTKFFDFIVPVIPVINKTNSGQKMMELLHLNDSDIDDNLKTDITEDFITNIAPYISDMRILRNIVNEFWIYKRTLKDEKNVNLKDYKMFSIMMYKNMYPEDFAKLESENGNVRDAFSNKNRAISVLKTELKTKIDVISTRQNDLMISSEKELRVLILSELSHGYEINDISTTHGNFNKNNLLNDDLDFSALFEQTFTVQPKHENSITYRNGKNDFDGYLNTLIKRYEAFRVTKGKNAETLKIECNKIEHDIINLQSMTLSKLIKKFGKKEVLPENVVTNDLLTFLLRNGYIDENYGQYINYFYPGSITEAELNYILSVRNFDGVDNKSLLIENAANVVKRMFDYEFEQSEALNYSMTDYLLSSNNNERYLNCLIRHIVNGTENSKKFITEYLNRNMNIALFMNCICKASKQVWEDIENDVLISADKKSEYFRYLMQYADLGDIVDNDYTVLEEEVVCDGEDEYIEMIESDKGITRYLTSEKSRLSNLMGVPEKRIIEVIDELELSFKETELSMVSETIFNHIVESWCYDLNFYMLQQICNRISPENSVDITKKNYSCLRAVGNGDILEYIKKYTVEYISDVVLLEENVDETKESIEELLNNVKNQVDIAKKLISHEKEAFWEKIDECVTDYDDEAKLIIWNFLMENNKVASTWSNINVYIKKFDLSKAVLQFMETNPDELFKDELSSEITNEIQLSIMKSEISEKFFCGFLKVSRIDISELGNSFSINKIKMMIEQDYLAFSSGIHDEIMEKDINLGIMFGLRNEDELFEHISECSISSEIIKKYIQSEKLSEEHLLVIINMLSPDEIDEETALKLRDCKFLLPKEYVIVSFDILRESDRYELLFNQLEIFELDEIPDLFSKLANVYNDFTRRDKQHKFTLHDTEYNRKLCNKLENMKFLTSSNIEENRHFDPVTSSEIVERRIVGNVKKAR